MVCGAVLEARCDGHISTIDAKHDILICKVMEEKKLNLNWLDQEMNLENEFLQHQVITYQNTLSLGRLEILLTTQERSIPTPLAD